VQHGFITDASSANIILYDGKNWMTPKKPLLRGTKRQILLERETIFEIDISMSQLDRFKYAAIINAMLDIGDTPFISMKNILLPIE
jgi:4-amino-4-deoxychorismate lyase